VTVPHTKTALERLAAATRAQITKAVENHDHAGKILLEQRLVAVNTLQFDKDAVRMLTNALKL
jgi:hypothetical protein